MKYQAKTHEQNRGSYMSAHILLNLLNELGKSDKKRGLPSILSLFTTCLINSIIQEHACRILFIIWLKIIL